MNVSYPLIDHEGTACMACRRELHVGDPYRQALVGMLIQGPVVIVYCVYCPSPEHPGPFSEQP